MSRSLVFARQPMPAAERLILAASPEEGKAEALTVLVVGDDTLAASYIASVLRDTGHIVAGSASCAPEALAIAAGAAIDVAVVDCQRREGQTRGPSDGVDVAIALRNRFGIPVILLTASEDAERSARARGLAPLIALATPLRPSRLFRALELVRRTRS